MYSLNNYNVYLRARYTTKNFITTITTVTAIIDNNKKYIHK